MASNYGWTLSEVLKLTYFQIKSLDKAADYREYGNRVIALHIQRVAFGADRDQCDRFLESLKPIHVVQESRNEGNLQEIDGLTIQDR